MATSKSRCSREDRLDRIEEKLALIVEILERHLARCPEGQTSATEVC